MENETTVEDVEVTGTDPVEMTEEVTGTEEVSEVAE